MLKFIQRGSSKLKGQKGKLGGGSFLRVNISKLMWVTQASITPRQMVAKRVWSPNLHIGVTQPILYAICYLPFDPLRLSPPCLAKLDPVNVYILLSALSFPLQCTYMCSLTWPEFNCVCLTHKTRHMRHLSLHTSCCTLLCFPSLL